MNSKLVAIAVGSALALGTITLHAQEHHRGGPGAAAAMMHHEWGDPLEHLTKELDLTPEQQAKVGPIVDQAKPQIAAIHQDAMQKTRAIIEDAGTKIRPLLNAQQQQKFDALKKAHEDMINAMQEMHAAKQH